MADTHAPEACIVGWAHTPFGKLGRPRRREPDRPRSAAPRSRMPASPRPRSTRSSSACSTTASPSQDFPSSLVLQSVPELRFKPRDAVRECLRHRLGRDPRRARLARRRARPLRPGDRRREDDRDARPAGRRHPARAPATGKRGRRHPGRLRRRVRPDRRGAISSATATSRTRWPRIAAKNHRNGVDNPYAQMRKDLGFEFCRAESARRTPTSRRR